MQTPSRELFTRPIVFDTFTRNLDVCDALEPEVTHTYSCKNHVIFKTYYKANAGLCDLKLPEHHELRPAAAPGQTLGTLSLY